MNSQKWSASDAAAMTGPQEVHLRTQRRDGSLRSPRIIWIVGDGDRVFIRSTNARGADWFRWAIATGTGRIEARGAEFDVRFEELTDEALEFAEKMFTLAREGHTEHLAAYIDAGLPVYGSCAGMIQLADEVLDGTSDQQTLGGMAITVRRNAFGRQVDSFETDLTMPALTEPERPVRAVFIRAPWVERVGDEVEVLATVPAGPAAGRIVAVRQDNLLATSFHPEVTGDARVHEYFVRLVREGSRPA